MLESHLPATTPSDDKRPREMTNEDRARAAAANANFGPMEAAIARGHPAAAPVVNKAVQGRGDQ